MKSDLECQLRTTKMVVTDDFDESMPIITHEEFRELYLRRIDGNSYRAASLNEQGPKWERKKKSKIYICQTFEVIKKPQKKRRTLKSAKHIDENGDVASAEQ